MRKLLCNGNAATQTLFCFDQFRLSKRKYNNHSEQQTKQVLLSQNLTDDISQEFRFLRFGNQKITIVTNYRPFVKTCHETQLVCEQNKNVINMPSQYLVRHMVAANIRLCALYLHHFLQNASFTFMTCAVAAFVLAHKRKQFN